MIITGPFTEATTAYSTLLSVSQTVQTLQFPAKDVPRTQEPSVLTKSQPERMSLARATPTPLGRAALGAEMATKSQPENMSLALQGRAAFGAELATKPQPERKSVARAIRQISARDSSRRSVALVSPSDDIAFRRRFAAVDAAVALVSLASGWLELEIFMAGPGSRSCLALPAACPARLEAGMPWECACSVLISLLRWQVSLVLASGCLTLASCGCRFLHASLRTSRPRLRACCPAPALTWLARLLLGSAMAASVAALFVSVVFLEQHALFMAGKGVAVGNEFPDEEMRTFFGFFIVFNLARLLVAIRLSYSVHVLCCLSTRAPAHPVLGRRPLCQRLPRLDWCSRAHPSAPRALPAAR